MSHMAWKGMYAHKHTLVMKGNQKGTLCYVLERDPYNKVCPNPNQSFFTPPIAGSPPPTARKLQNLPEGRSFFSVLSRLTPDAADPQCAFIVDVVLNVVLVNIMMMMIIIY